MCCSVYEGVHITEVIPKKDMLKHLKQFGKKKESKKDLAFT